MLDNDSPLERISEIAAFGRSMWAPLEWVIDEAANSLAHDDVDTSHLRDTAAVRNVLTRYCYHYDAKNLPALMDLFSDDCILITPRGTYIGRDAIRRNYAYMMSLTTVVLHSTSNVGIRVGGASAWMTAYLLAVSADVSGETTTVAGTFVDRLDRTPNGWIIVERRITANLRSPRPDAASRAAAGPPPEPNLPDTSGDWIERDWLD